jgi:hypothetical protein
VILKFKYFSIYIFFLGFCFSAQASWIKLETAHFKALDKITARIKQLDIIVNEEQDLGTLIIKLKSCQNRPPDYLPDSAAYIEIYDKMNLNDNDTGLIFSGWMFSSSPALSALEHPVYDISLISCK